jgi:hypothetical protein
LSFTFSYIGDKLLFIDGLMVISYLHYYYCDSLNLKDDMGKVNKFNFDDAHFNDSFNYILNLVTFYSVPKTYRVPL